MMLSSLAAVIISTGSLLPATGFAAPDAANPLDEIRRAKIGLAGFLVDHIDRPLRISEPCPTLSAESAGSYVGTLGLVPSAREYGPAVVFDGDIGSGIVALRCGNDLARSPDPAESVALSTDVAMLDGQATFEQYAVDLGGRDLVVTDVTVSEVGDSTGRQAGRCSNGGRDCTAAVEVDDLVVTVRLRGLPADTGDRLARQLAVAVTPEIVTNLAALTSTDD